MHPTTFCMPALVMLLCMKNTAKDSSLVEKIFPEVFPIVSFGNKDSSLVSFGCFIRKYFPNPIEVKWNTTTGEILSNAKNFPFNDLIKTSSYSLVSQVTVSTTDWERKLYQCNVEHFSSRIQKTIPKGCIAPPQFPTVQLQQGTCPDSTNGQVEVTCQAYNLTSQDALVKWFINDKEKNLQQDLLELGKSTNHLFVLHSTVSISQAEWNNGARVKCAVTDKGTSKSAEGTIRKCAENFNCLGINVFILPPSIEDLYIHNTARITCVASNLKDADSGTFSWSYPGSPNMQGQVEDALLEKNGTYSKSSVLTVSIDAWMQYTEITCVFSHTQLSTPIITRITRRQETRVSLPFVALFPPTPEEMARKEMYTLVCVAYNHYPSDIYIGWKENEREVSKNRYINSDPKAEAGGQSYFTVSMLTVSAEYWDNGGVCSCVVGHEAIPLHFATRTIDKNSDCCSHTNITISVVEEGDMDNPWEISATFMSLFVLSLVYSITVTLFKVK